VDSGFIGERFEAEELETFNAHARQAVIK